MKSLKYSVFALFAAAMTCMLGSCKQDLGQDPPFDYPQEEPEGVQLPDPLYHSAFDGDLFLDGTLKGTMSTYTGESPLFTTGQAGEAYQNQDGEALILTPDASAMETLKALGSYSIFMWIKFDGTNTAATNLFSIGNKAVEVGELSFFIDTGNASNPLLFFFKGYMKSTGDAKQPEVWFDAGDDAKVDGLANRWVHVGLTYDVAYDDGTNEVASSTITLYVNGGAICSRELKKSGDVPFGPLNFNEISGICLGAFPSQIGLGSGTGWTATGAFFTGAMDEFAFYNVALTPGQVAALYEMSK